MSISNLKKKQLQLLEKKCNNAYETFNNHFINLIP